MFPCRQLNHLYGNYTFPLEWQSMNSENISCLEFLIKLKSHHIARNVKINKLLKSRENVVNLRTNFPAENKNIRTKTFPRCLNVSDNFPFKNSKSTESESKFEILSNSSPKSKCQQDLSATEIEKKANTPPTLAVNNNKQSLKFPLFRKPQNGKSLHVGYKKPKDETTKVLNQAKLHQLSSQIDLHLKYLRNITTSDDIHRLTKFPLIKAGKPEIYSTFPLKFNTDLERISCSRNGSKMKNFNCKFPFKRKQNNESFPCEIMQLKCEEFKANYPIFKIKNTLPDFRNVCVRKNEKPIKKFPFEKFGKHKIYKNFPLHVKNYVENIKDSFFTKQTRSIEDLQQLENSNKQQIPTHSLNGKTWNNINNSKTSRTQTTSRSMTHNLHKQNCQKSQQNNNEYATQVHVENPAAPSPSMIAAIANDDLRILPAINSKNKPQSSQMAHYTENIEHNNDAIIIISNVRDCTPKLVEKTRNSLTTNHKNEFEYFGSADAATEFALTPPRSVTSVQNTERTGSEKKIDDNYYIHDLSDLCNPQVGQIVECSDVRDTLDKTVVYGGANLKSRTGSFLVKNQEQTSPAPPNPLTIQSDSVVSTSLENYTTSETLPNYYVLELCESFDSNRPEIAEIKTTVNNHIQIEKEEDKSSHVFFTETQMVKRDNILSEKVNDMTITRYTDDEGEERDGGESKAQLNEVLEQSKNILIDDLKIDEMKFEMKSVKGALPSTASGRSVGKYEDSITGSSSFNNSGYNRSRPLRSSIDSSATTTRNFKNDNNNTLSLNSLRTDSNLPTNSTSNRISFNDFRTPSDNIISNSVFSRPSLNALRNSNSASILSVDLPRFNLATDSLGPLRPNAAAIDRATSIDTSSYNVLPERTRLRRQRRLRTQDSQDEPEDPIERLNLLKARISASLSEVKGVLKQYSTEENANENQATNVSTPLSSLKENNDEAKKEDGLVSFRFVKKIRRRSLFNEEDDKKNMLIETEEKATGTVQNKDETDKSSIDNRKNNKYWTNKLEPKIQEEKLSSLTTLPSQYIKIPKEISKVDQQETEIEANKLTAIEPETVVQSQRKTNELQTKHGADEIQNIAKKLATRDVTPYPNKSENTETHQPEITKNQRVLKIEATNLNQSLETNLENRETSPKSKITSINKEEEATDTQQLEIDRNLCAFKKEDTQGATPKQPKKVGQSSSNESNLKTKKKLIVENKGPPRRSSLAAVEASKIEPPVKVAIPAKIQRRPSDSEAVVKKKLITVKTTTSGVVEEVTPKPKIVKVKRSLHKKHTGTSSTINTKLAAMPPNISNDHVKPTDDHPHNKSRYNDTNKDALMPNARTLDQQINGDTVDQNTKLLATQLEIDENASLNEKSNDNLVLPQQLQQQQLATNESTTTKLTSNQLNRGIGGSGAMLQILTTVVSSKTTSEANGQIIDKKSQSEDFHDLLQQEAVIVKPSQTNENNLKEPQPEVQEIIENKISPTELEAQSTLPPPADEKLNNKLEFTRRQQQQQQQQQQVVESTDKLIVKKNEDVNIIKTNDDDHHQPSLTTAEESTVTSATTKTISSPQISISATQDITEKTTTSTGDQIKNTNQANMPELKLTPAPVQTAATDCQLHKKKVIIKKIIRQTSVEKAKKLQEISQKPEDKIEIPPEDTANEPATEDKPEEYSDSTEISESSASLPCEEADAAAVILQPIKERKIKKKVIIKRQKRRLSIGDTFFNHAEVEEPQTSEVETFEKAVAYFSDEEVDKQEEPANEPEEEKKPLKSCIMLKQYHIGDEVLYAERFKKTQVKWRRGRITERITSISYMIEIDGKEISSHINYLKKYTGRKVNFGGKEYLEIDYEQLAEEEEKAEKLQRRSYSIWNMV